MNGVSFKEQRLLMELAAAGHSVEAIALRLKRPAKTILKMARQLGVSIKGREAKGK